MVNKAKLLVVLITMILLNDLNAQVLIEADEFMPFVNGYAAIRRGNKCGFIDTTGKIVIDFIVDGKFPLDKEYPCFKEDLCRAFNASSNRFGYIDKKGNWVIKPIFLAASDFKEGLAIVMGEGYTHFVIDKTGLKKFSIEEGSQSDIAYCNGLSLLQRKHQYGYIDRNGKIVIPIKYLGASYFSMDGLAAVLDVDQYGVYKWGYINKLGELVIKPTFNERPSDFNNGRALVKNKEGYFGYIDKKGKLIIETMYKNAFPFVNGVALVAKEEDYYNNKYTIIDTTGNTIKTIANIRPYNNFIGEYALVQNQDGLGFNFLNLNGNLAFKYYYDYAYTFNNGLALVSYLKTGTNETIVGYLDSNGNMKIKKTSPKF